MTDFYTAREFAQFIKGLGFRAFVAGSLGGEGPRGYGFFTNADGSRVVSFSMDDGHLSGNYGPPSRTAGTGWQMNATVWSIKTRADVQQALDAMPPDWCQRKTRERDGWQHMTTLEQHLGMYGSSSKYEEI